MFGNKPSVLILAVLPQIFWQEAGESWEGGACGKGSEPGEGRLLVLDSVLRHLPAGSPETAERRAAVQDAARR